MKFKFVVGIYVSHYLEGIAWPPKELEEQQYFNECIRFRVMVGQLCFPFAGLFFSPKKTKLQKYLNWCNRFKARVPFYVSHCSKGIART
jgi:hypothetical protein